MFWAKTFRVCVWHWPVIFVRVWQVDIDNGKLTMCRHSMYGSSPANCDDRASHGANVLYHERASDIPTLR